MSSVVELPLWFVILAGVFAAIALAERALIPSVRWYLRRRAEKLIARLNERLERPIEPFKLARRFDTIQRLIYDRDVLAAVAEHARDQGVPEDVAFEDARRYAREIVPSFSAFTYFKLGTRGARWLSRALYRVRLTHYDLALSNVPPDATVVFVMNHRSNMDYVLITHLASERSALSYAVGEWARIWPLSRLIRMMGAYFIRRKSRTALYRRVLDRYVQMATEAGVTQAIFPEGGLSLDGRLAPPKVGLLAYVLKAYVPGGRDIVFVPVALNYDRVLEDRMLIAADQAGERRFRGSIWEVLGFLGRQIKLRLTGGFHRFGYAAVSFGEPLAVSTYGEAVPGAEVLAGELMARIGAVVPALPVPLVAGLLMQEDGLSRETLVQRFAERVAQLPEASRHVPRDDPAYGAEVGLRMLTLRNLVRVQDGR
ncbi:MAG: 1-acyl-sn-glycerol-3-phosphate acyltransferase, partial [Pseudomonadota bacterium]